MLKTKQYIVVGSVILLMGALYSLDIKGLIKPKEERSVESNPTEVAAGNAITSKEVSAVSKQLINASLAADISKLEESLSNTSGKEKLQIQKSIAQKWDDVNQPAPAAFAYEAIAEVEPSLSNWLITGDRFTTAYQNYSDTTAIPTLVDKAINAYKTVLKLDSSNLDGRTGLGVAYVTGTPNPMQGIQLLLNVVKEAPKNLKANMNLGLFSMKSNQFQKAIDRFKTVISIKESPEAYFYMATSYENLGQKKEAIEAYQKSKQLAADPGLSGFVDQKIKTLSN